MAMLVAVSTQQTSGPGYVQMLHIATQCSFPFQEMRDRVRIDVEREKGID